MTINTLTAKKYKLHDLVEIKAGYPFRGAVKKVIGGGVWVVQARDIAEPGELVIDSTIETELTGKRDPDWLTKDDVLFINKGQRAIACHIDQDYEHTTCSPSLFILKTRKDWVNNLNMKFIAWYLNQTPAQNYFKRTAEGSNQVSIRKQTLGDLIIGIPSLEEQTILAGIYTNSIQQQKVLTSMISNIDNRMSLLAQDLLKSESIAEKTTRNKDGKH